MSVDLATLGIRVDASQVNKADRDLESLEKTGRKVENTAANLGNALRNAFVGIGLAAVTKQAIAMADAYSGMQGRLSLVTKGTAELGVVTERLYEISQRSRGSFEETSNLYAKLAQSTSELKVNQSDLLNVTETISKALIVSGAAASESEGALRQLGQAFASGALRGDELNSIMEGTPRLARAIAEGMGISIGQLRAFGKEGKLTASSIFDALISQQQVIEQEFARMPTTVGQSFVLLGNSMLKFVGQANETLGVTIMLADGVKFMAENLDAAVPILGAVAAIFALSLAPALNAVLLGALAATEAFLANAAAATLNSLAMVRLSASISLTGTVMGAATTAVRGLTAALVALSGLALVAFLTAAAGAIMYFKATTLSAAEATSMAEKSSRSYVGALTSLAEYQKKAGIATTETNKAIDAALGITKLTTSAADAAAGAALRRAAAERQLTIDILNRAAAEARADGEKLQTSARNKRWSANASGASAIMVESFGPLAGVFGMDADKDWANSAASNRDATTDSNFATQAFRRSADLSRRAVEAGNAPLTPLAATPTTAVVDKDKDKTKAKTEEERALERATDAAKEYSAQLDIETANMGKSAIEQQRMATARAAALAPTKELRDAIEASGKAWEDATRKFETDKLVTQLKAANDETEHETNLQGKNALERERANAQRAVSVIMAEAEASGVDLNSEALKEETKRLLENAEARGQKLLAGEQADNLANTATDFADRMRDATDGIRGLFGETGDGIANLMNTWTEYGAHVAQIQADLANVQGEGAQAEAERARLNGELAQAEIDNYGNMLSSAKSFFEEKSTGYRVMQAAEQAYRLYQFAMAVQAMFFDTAETTSAVANSAVRVGVDTAETASSVAKSGVRAAADGVAAFAKTLASLPFPFNLAAGAVVIAALVGVGVAMKGKSGGSAGGATSAVKEEKPTSYTPFVDQNTYANDNVRGVRASGGPSIAPVASAPVGSNKPPIQVNFNGNISGSSPAETAQLVRDVVINELAPVILQDARQQSSDDMQNAATRQRLGNG